MPHVFNSVHPGEAGYRFVIASLEKIFRNQGVFPTDGSFARELPVPVRAVCLVFGRPACKVFKEELLPDRTYYHLRSGENVELFYMGYTEPSQGFISFEDRDENGFSFGNFVRAVDDFESRTTWEYSGQTDIILLNASFSSRRIVHLDFSNVFSVQLEDAVESGLIRSGRSLIEEIIRQSKDCASSDVVARVGNAVFLKNARQTFLSWVMGLIRLKPEDLTNVYKSCVRDVSRF